MCLRCLSVKDWIIVSVVGSLLSWDLGFHILSNLLYAPVLYSD